MEQGDTSPWAVQGLNYHKTVEPGHRTGLRDGKQSEQKQGVDMLGVQSQELRHLGTAGTGCRQARHQRVHIHVCNYMSLYKITTVKGYMNTT